MMNPTAHRRKWTLALLGGAALVSALAGGTLALSRIAAGSAPAGASSGDALFDISRLWTIHLVITEANWRAMEPAAADGPLGPGGPGGRGGPGGGGPGPRGGPSGFIASAILRQGDLDTDGVLSRDEFTALGTRWFSAWDPSGRGQVDEAQVSSGMDAAVMLGDGRGGPGGRGGAGAPGGREGPAGPGGPSFVGQVAGRNGMSAAMGIDFQFVPADFEFEGRFFPDVRVRYKGNSTFVASRDSLKRSLKVDLNRGHAGRRLGGVATLNLHNNTMDAGWMNEVLSYRLFRDAGVPASRTSYARVFVSVAGQYDREYLGLYSIVENVDNDFARDRFGTKKGALFKPATSAPFEDLGDAWSAYEQGYDPKTPVSAEETDRVIAFARLVSHATDAEFNSRVEEFLDLDEFARFMAVTVWLSNMDSILGMGQNYVVYLHPKTRQFQFIPWDLDHSFGQFMGGPQQSAGLDILRPWNGSIRLLERVFTVERFRTLYRARMQEFSRTIFAPARLRAQVDELAAVLRPAVQEESAVKLARFDRVVAGLADTSAEGAPPSSDPGALGLRDGPGRGGGSIKSFVSARAESVAGQLAGRSAGQQQGDAGGRGGPGGFLGRMLMAALDADHSGTLTRDELIRGFVRWFDLWDLDASGFLTEDALRAGLARDLLPNGPGGPRSR